ncbi:MAG TPA: Fe-S cluster assembly ATPase SufC, partial [Acidobacteriota bacterium]
EVRAREGLFLAFQYPVEIPGVMNFQFLKSAFNEIRKHRGLEEMDSMEFSNYLDEKVKLVEMDVTLINRRLNEGFSGGEKKRNEILQMAVLEPRLAILDETDSGLDIDALKSVASAINKLRKPDNAIVLVTHYQRILNYITPDFVHVLVGGRIVKSGGSDLAHELESRGYDWIRESVEEPA